MSKFKVGDRVRVREWEDMEREFGLTKYGSIRVVLPFLPQMHHLCGNTATVIKVHSKINIELGDWKDKRRDCKWVFCDEMLTFADDAPEYPVPEDPRDMTLTEIEAALGYRVRIVNNHE